MGNKQILTQDEHAYEWRFIFSAITEFDSPNDIWRYRFI